MDEELPPEGRMLLLDTAEAWIKLADRLENSSISYDPRATYVASRTLH